MIRVYFKIRIVFIIYKIEIIFFILKVNDFGIIFIGCVDGVW